MYNDFDNVELFNKDKDKDKDPVKANIDALNALVSNNIDQTLRRSTRDAAVAADIGKPQLTKDDEVEAIALLIGNRLKATDLRPIYAACYAGIDYEKLESIAAQACLVGRVPMKLFMYLIMKEPEWKAWQLRRKEWR